MKEFEIENYYGKGADKQIGKQDYDREMDRLKAEKAARKKYVDDETVKADIAERERLNKEREKAAREKQLEERKARVEAEKQEKKNEEKERARVKQQRQKAIDNFDTLGTEEMVLLLNDEEDVQIFFEKMFTDCYEKFKVKDSVIRDTFDKLPKYNINNIKEEDLKKADHLFRILYGDLAEIELPYLHALTEGNVPADNELKDNLIVSNFTHGVRSIEDTIGERLAEKGLDETTIARVQKLFILNQIKNAYESIETRTEIDLDEAKENDPEKYKQDKDKIFKEAEEKNIKHFVGRIQYKCFVAEKDRDGKLEVIRPAKDFDKFSLKRKFWLKDHPETEGKQYTQEDLGFQLELAKGCCTLVAQDQKLSDAVVFKYTKEQRVPSSLNRKKYELRELQSAYIRQADSCDLDHSELKEFNLDMAFLCDYEQGDLRKLMTEKPHIGELIRFVQNGPLLHTSFHTTQIEMYDELNKHEHDNLIQYMYLTHSIVDLVRAEYKRQEYERTGWDKDKEKEFKADYEKAIDNMSYRVEKLSKIDLNRFNNYSAKDMRRFIKPVNGVALIDNVRIATYEVGAMARGWSPSDTFMFAMIGAISYKARSLRKEADDYDERKNYDQISEDLYKLNNDLDKADTAIKKRDVLERFDAFVRKNVKNTALLAPLNTQQLEYDRVRTKFDEEYKQTVINELKALENNTTKLATEMIKMQKLALEREEDFHDQIFKEYITSLDQNKQIDLQKALYRERLNQMVNRGRKASDERDAIFDKKELANLRYNKVIFDDMYSQIGAILSKSDEVEAADRLMSSFTKPIDKKDKDAIYNAKIEEMDKKATRTYNGDLTHDTDYYNFLAAEKMEKPRTDLGINLVTAPGGGYNIKYDKEVSEIRKEVFQRGEAQVEDLAIELGRLRTNANQFLFEISDRKAAGLDDFRHVSDDFKYHLRELAHAEKWSIVSYAANLSSIRDNAKEALEKVENDKNPVKGEENFYKKILSFAEKGLETISPKNYPDLNAATEIGVYKKEIEVARKLLENKDPNFKWEVKPTERIKQKQENANAAEKQLNEYYSALSSVVGSKDADLDKAYLDGFFFKPTKILEMVGKCYNALRAIDGDNVSKESEEYQDFYYALMDMKDAYDPRKLDPNDGSHIALERLTELNRATEAYLNSVDKSKNASLRKNVADIVRNLYLTKQNGFETKFNFNDFENWAKNDNGIRRNAEDLSLEAKKLRQARIDADKKAADEKKKLEDEKDQKRRDKEAADKRINTAESKAKSDLSLIEKRINDEKYQINSTQRNIDWANQNIKNGIDVGSMKVKISGYKETIKACQDKIKAYEAQVKPLNKKLDDLAKERATVKKDYEDYLKAVSKAEEKKLADEKAERAKRREERLDPALAAKRKAEREAALLKGGKKVGKRDDPLQEAPKKEEKKVEQKKAEPKKEEKKAEPKKEEKKPESKKEEKKAEPKKEEKKPEPKKEVPKKEEIKKDNDIIRINDNKNENIININEPVGKRADKNVDIEADKKADAVIVPNAKKAKPPVGYEGYYILHSADKKGRNHKEKVENLAKVMAAAALEGNGKKFSVSKIHDYKDVMMENFNLTDMTEDKLNEYLESPKNAKKALHKLTNEMYKVTDINAYFDDLKTLLDNMKSSKGRSDEYKDMVSRIEKTVALKDKIFENDEARQRQVNYSAFLVSFTVDKYMKGKKSVRTFEGGRDRFDNSLDALAIVSKYAPNAAPRIKKLTDRINEVRNDKNHKINLNEYGAERAKDAKRVRDERKAPKAKNK